MSKFVIRTLRILETIAASEEIGVTELAKQLALSKSTVFRIVNTINELGYIRKNKYNDKYSLTIKLFVLGSKSLERLDLIKEARSIMENLAQETSETVHLCILDDDAVIYLEKIDSPHLLRMFSRIGKRAPAYCTGVGKVLLAWEKEEFIDRKFNRKLEAYTSNTITDLSLLKEALKKIQKNGFGLDNEEHELGIKCVAAPIKNRKGEVIASISISCPSLRLQEKELERYKGLIINAANDISIRLGYNS